MADDVQLTVYISAAAKKRLDVLKEEQGITITKFIELAVLERLERVESALEPLRIAAQ